MLAEQRPKIAALVLLAPLALLLAAGCAKKGPPTGGPLDLTPPRVVDTGPDSGAARVPVDTVLTLTFSEGMEPRSTVEAISIAPRVEIRRRRWSRRTVTLELAEPLQPRQTYTLFVADGARDLHNNPLRGGSTVVFSTADSFPAGRIEGSVEARGFEGTGTALWCYEDVPGRVPDSTARDFDAIGIAGTDSRFRIDGLAVPGRYRIWAFADLNRNHSFEPESDILAPADTVLALTPARPVAGPVLLRLTNPRAPAMLTGTVLDSLGDSLGTIRVVAVADSDTTQRVVRDADPRGTFQLSLAAGRYRIAAFRDLDRNRVWDPLREPASEEVRYRIEPAAEVKDVVLVLRRARRLP